MCCGVSQKRTCVTALTQDAHSPHLLLTPSSPRIPPYRLTAGSPPAFDILSLQLTRLPPTPRARPGRGRRRRIRRRRNAARSRRKPSLSPCTPAKPTRCTTWSTRRRRRTLTSSTSSSTRASTCNTRCDHWFERIRYIDRVCVCVRDTPITDPLQRDLVYVLHLVSLPPSPSLQDGYQNTALMYATLRGFTAAVEAIVAADPHPDHIRMTNVR